MVFYIDIYKTPHISVIIEIQNQNQLLINSPFFLPLVDSIKKIIDEIIRINPTVQRTLKSIFLKHVL